MKQLLLLTSFLLPLLATAQTGSFTDPRDGQQYKTIVIEGKLWLRENLRFQSDRSYCPNFNKTAADCINGNYYSVSELDSICPKGWHVATIPEWESYLGRLFKENNIHNGIIKYDTSTIVKNHFSIRIPDHDLFKDTLLLLNPTGWVEGIRLMPDHDLSLWIRDLVIPDDKYHVHIGKEGYIKHTHEHHIIDKPKKVRKFPVRCVCETAQ